MLWYFDLPLSPPGVPDSRDLSLGPGARGELAGLFAARPTDLPEHYPLGDIVGDPAAASRRHLRRQLRTDRSE